MKRFKKIILALMMGAGISASAAFVYNTSFIGTPAASATETFGAAVVRQEQSNATGATQMAGQPNTALNSRGDLLQNSQSVSSPEGKKALPGGCANCTGCNSQCMNNRN